MSADERARRIDRLLAEHLFGMEITENAFGLWAWEKDGAGNVTHSEELKGYSATGDGMLRVLEAMRSKGWAFIVLYAPSDHTPLVQFHQRDKGDFQRGFAALPMAVAMAALKAIGVVAQRQEAAGFTPAQRGFESRRPHRINAEEA